MHIEDLEGQLIIKPPVVAGAKHEAVCHLCTWSFHRWTDEDARAYLRAHIIDAHLNPQNPYDFTIGTGPSTS